MRRRCEYESFCDGLSCIYAPDLTELISVIEEDPQDAVQQAALNQLEAAATIAILRTP